MCVFGSEELSGELGCCVRPSLSAYRMEPIGHIRAPASQHVGGISAGVLSHAPPAHKQEARGSGCDPGKLEKPHGLGVSRNRTSFPWYLLCLLRASPVPGAEAGKVHTKYGSVPDPLA